MTKSKADERAAIVRNIVAARDAGTATTERHPSFVSANSEAMRVLDEARQKAAEMLAEELRQYREDHPYSQQGDNAVRDEYVPWDEWLDRFLAPWLQPGGDPLVEWPGPAEEYEEMMAAWRMQARLALFQEYVTCGGRLTGLASVRDRADYKRRLRELGGWNELIGAYIADTAVLNLKEISHGS